MDHGWIGVEKEYNIVLFKDKLQLIYSLKNEHTKVMKHKQIELESLKHLSNI